MELHTLGRIRPYSPKVGSGATGSFLKTRMILLSGLHPMPIRPKRRIHESSESETAIVEPNAEQPRGRTACRQPRPPTIVDLGTDSPRWELRPMTETPRPCDGASWAMRRRSSATTSAREAGLRERQGRREPRRAL